MFGRSKPIRIAVFGKTDLGRTRDHNEDRFLVADLTRKAASLQPDVRQHDVGPRGTLLVVADGMGGAAAGEVASEMATDTIYAHLLKTWNAEDEVTPQRFAYRLKEAVEVANASIHAHAKAHPEVRGMGTTTTAAGVLNDHLYLTQVGDSRAYLIRGGEAYQITKDQSLMQRLVEAGELTEEEAAQSERRNIILQALGPDPKVKVDLTHQEVRAVCDKLIALANERGGPDNITVVVARFDGDGLRVSDGAQQEEVGHQVYPLIDTETSTEPVPVYKGSRPPLPNKEIRKQTRTMVLALLAVAALLVWYFTRKQ